MCVDVYVGVYVCLRKDRQHVVHDSDAEIRLYLIKKTKRLTLTTKSTNFYVSCRLCLSEYGVLILRIWTFRAQV